METNGSPEIITEIHVINPDVSNETVLYPDYFVGTTFSTSGEGEVSAANWDPDASTSQLDSETTPSAVPNSAHRKSSAAKDKWKREVAKRMRCQGQSYLGFRRLDKNNTNKIKQDIQRSAVTFGPPCTSKKCVKARSCKSIAEADRQELFKHFWKLEEWKEKKIYILDLIERKEPKQRTKKVELSRRENSFAYHLKIGPDKIPVCRQLFESTFGLKWSTIRNWIKKHNSIAPGEEKEDKRGNQVDKDNDSGVWSSWKERQSFMESFLVQTQIEEPNGEDEVPFGPDEGSLGGDNGSIGENEVCLIGLHLSKWLQDESQIFFNFVASQFRSINNPEIKQRLKLDIQRRILESLEEDAL